MSYARQRDNARGGSSSFGASSSSSDRGKPLLNNSDPRSARGGADDEKLKKAQEAVKSISGHVAEIKKQTQKLNQPSVSSKLLSETKGKVHDAEKAASGVSEEAAAALRSVVIDIKGDSSPSKEQQLLSSKKQKLGEGLEQSLESLRVASDAYRKREEEAEAAVERARQMEASAASTATASRPPARPRGKQDGKLPETVDVELGEGTRVAPRQQDLQDVTDAELDMHNNIVHEFSNQVTTLQEDMTSLHNSMRQVAQMVQDQGETLESIESNMSQAEEDTSRANEELRVAGQHQQRGNKRIWWILLLTVIFAIILITVLVATNK